MNFISNVSVRSLLLQKDFRNYLSSHNWQPFDYLLNVNEKVVFRICHELYVSFKGNHLINVVKPCYIINLDILCLMILRLFSISEYLLLLKA